METFTAMVLRERDFLRNACARLLVVPDDAEDAVQETFERAWRHRARMPGDALGQRRWLCVIARNLCLDRDRRAGRWRRALPVLAERERAGGDTAHEALVRVALGAANRAALSLSRLDREALARSLEAGLCGYELAARLGVSRNAAYMRLHRAQARLRRSVEW